MEDRETMNLVVGNEVLEVPMEIEGEVIEVPEIEIEEELFSFLQDCNFVDKDEVFENFISKYTNFLFILEHFTPIEGFSIILLWLGS